MKLNLVVGCLLFMKLNLVVVCLLFMKLNLYNYLIYKRMPHCRHQGAPVIPTHKGSAR